MVVRGAGFGHGIGMSQYGAYGFAQKGVGYERILQATTTGAPTSVELPAGRYACCCRPATPTCAFAAPRAARAGGR